ncbi:heterokaryon incompatibility protein 6, OR allele [Colletotrichum spaethianum]|uniref:Heterokaryon incompatibility protein 6, OR allele n=1 Tax=Colletotrichum spaethianum TaxID=700344 RepID=A0AA37LCJ8_9PEZI|nr:heterokaryon incompatibility protein 6, OR allele [Colletotrichum spaethianum]GKT46151.1 heterokaryon incompatibility protein 6, OR allele [Colletotrichum spaethianum]
MPPLSGRTAQWLCLELAQPASSFSSPVVARLSVVHHNTATKEPPAHYEALSYRWGDPNDRSTIFINGSGVSVLKDLEIALRHFRYDNEELVLWADAICINQDDIEERNVQVALMGTIYSKSYRLRIWLGEPGPDTAAAMKLMDECSEYPPDADGVKKIFNDERGSTGLTELLGREYWSRMWMFQEILLSKIARVYCGRYTANFDGIKYLDMVSANARLWPEPSKTPPWVLPLRRALVNTTQFTINPSRLGELENMLVLTRRLQAGDPRDKLFALMGTCDMAPYLAVDYSKPARDVYIEEDGESSTVDARRVGEPEGQTDTTLPSWTPDFRASKRVAIYVGYGIEIPGVFNASKGTRFTAASHSGHPFNHSDTTLVAEGLLLDTIQKTAPVVKINSCPEQMIFTFGLGQVGRHPSGRSQVQAFCETIIFDIYGPRDGDSAEKNKSRQQIRLQHLLGFMKHMETIKNNAVPRKRDGSVDFPTLFGPEASRPGSVVRRYEDLKRSQPDLLEEHHKLFMKEYLYRAGNISSMFSTGGHYFGRCNHSVQPGDVVALLFGCTLPVILRKTQSGFKLIGAAYVSGLMHGELMDNPRRDLRVQRIPLV